MRRAPQRRFGKGPADPAAIGVRPRDAARIPAAHAALLSLQRTSGNQAVTNLLDRGSGRPLDPGTRSEMEAKFGQDFGGVRVHNSEAAHQATLRSGARALTEGQDIAFGDGFYAPGTGRGKQLIAHELAHVVQQTRSDGRNVSARAAESEAREAGAQVARGGDVTVQASSSGGAQADPMTKEEIQQAIANNEAQAEKATSQADIQALFEERNALYDDLKNAPEKIAVPGGDVQPDATPPPKPRPVRTDYAADENAYSGIELEYTAKDDLPVKEIYTPGVYKSTHYWLAPHMRSGTEKVVYYIAYNPETKRNEFAVGPDQVQNFLAHEDLYWYNAAAAYPLAGELPDYKAKSGRVVAKMMQGKWGQAFDAWKDSWSSAVKDPQFYVESVTATAGLAAGPEATELESAAANTSKLDTAAANVAKEGANVADEIPKNTPATPPPEAQVSTPAPNDVPAPAPTAVPTPAATFAPTAATTTDQVFAEIDSELECVPDAPGELQGTAQGEFQSPKPLSSSAVDTPIQTPKGAAVRESAGASPRGDTFQSASAQTSRSMNTAIRADVGEAEAYKGALERGEIGLERPGGSNVPGADFITAAEGADGEITIYANDAKTSSVGKFPNPKGPALKATWQSEVEKAVDRMDLGDPVLEAKIRDALAKGRVYVRQINVDYSPAGQGTMSGF